MTALVLVLIGATAASFGVAERLKLERSPVTAPRFTRLIGPTCDCRRATAKLRLRLRVPEQVDATVVDRKEQPVRTLATDLPRPRGVLRLTWDGRDEAGEVVPDGRYRLRVHLDRRDRTILVPTPIWVDSTLPRIRLVGLSRSVVSPDGDRRGDRMFFRYRTSERAYPIVYVEGMYAVRGQWRPAGRGRVPWRGRLEKRPLDAGRYEAWLVAVDLAGNRSEPTERVVVRVRYVEIEPSRTRVRQGRRLALDVAADARTVRWALARAGRVVLRGRARPGRLSVSLPRGLRPGRYVLRVSANGRSDGARVTVTR